MLRLRTVASIGERTVMRSMSRFTASALDWAESTCA